MEMLTDLKKNGPYITGFMLCSAAALALLHEGYIGGVLLLTFPAIYTMIFEDRQTPPSAETEKTVQTITEQNCLVRVQRKSTYEEACEKIDNETQ